MEETKKTTREETKKRSRDESKRVLFVDNDPKNWLGDMSVLRETVNNFESPNFHDDIRNSLITGDKSSSAVEWDRYMTLFGDNSYVDFLNTQMLPADLKKLKTHIPTNGVNPTEIITECQEKGYLLVIFDFDRTITCVEGIAIKDIVIEKTGKYGKYQESQGSSLLTFLNENPSRYNDLLNFLMGGPDRVLSLKLMFQNLKDNGVGFVIITHNPNAASKKNKLIFSTLLSMLTGLDIDYCDKILFCTKGRFKYKKYLAACAEETPFYTILESACRAPQDTLPKPKTHSPSQPTVKKTKRSGKSKTKSKTPSPSLRRGGRSKKNKTRRNHK